MLTLAVRGGGRVVALFGGDTLLLDGDAVAVGLDGVLGVKHLANGRRSVARANRLGFVQLRDSDTCGLCARDGWSAASDNAYQALRGQ